MKANKPEEDTSWKSPWASAAGLAHRVLGHGESCSAGVRDPRRRARPSLPHHENELAQSTASATSSRDLDAQRDAPLHRREDVQVRGTSSPSGRQSQSGGGGAAVFFLTGHCAAIDFSEESVKSAATRADSFREVFRNPSEPAAPGAWDSLVETISDDFNTPEALAILHGWRDHDLLRRALGIFGLASLSETEYAPAELVELAELRQKARDDRNFGEADRLRAEIDLPVGKARRGRRLPALPK